MAIDSPQGLWRTLVGILGQEQMADLARAAGIGAAVGVALGLGFSWLVYRAFRRLDWYHCRSTAGRWGQRGVGLATCVGSAVLLGMAGASEAVNRRLPAAIQHGPLGTQKLSGLGSVLADGLFQLDALAGAALTKTPEDEAQRQAFLAGRVEFNAPRFLERMGAIRDELYPQMLGQLESSLTDKNLQWAGQWQGELLRRIIQMIGPALLDQKASTELRKYHLEYLIPALRDGLVNEAARAGNPSTLSYRELSAYLQRTVLHPAIIQPAHSFVRQQQVLCVVGTLFLCLFPPAAFRLCRQKAPVNSPAAA